ncbi:24_t:CDS:1 [Funneliformis mosseae]|uniref:24_t:CDS:1 n=1 Tax=Funneliformis mosseae TaxID=27381 RepID=A0A9N9E3Q5_FUNMO|nr:24_t:CDS:1 [Funneliformis mosseae]
MSSQRNRRNQNAILNDFLSRINYLRIYPPYNSNAQILAAQTRNCRSIPRITGIHLMKRNIKREANRLHVYCRHIIDLTTNHVWNFSTAHQREQFTMLANDINNINRNRVLLLSNAETVNRMFQITIPQATSSEFDNAFFNGSSFP